ncbi:3-oxoacyl-ACP reductase FabG [Kurthia massiliensis]|uniref:3-oxoacyl-ACP reductase FabG n=1 Tax=Kurthia massiliensis TaxID=1033739 RepID=UPI0002898263|nr:3-oxoacyl-ACP reductase FabG [Kurthia massiliensis]
MRLENKVAIITGAANGIGEAAAKKFVAEGAKVIVADFADAGEEVAKNLGDAARFFKVDVSNKESVESMVQFAVDQFGTVDILVNNAGITRDAMLHKMTEEQFDDVINVNVKGAFNCTQAVYPILKEKQYGRIITTSSVSGIYGNVGQTNYAASKAAVVGMTKTWAKEFGRNGVTANAVAPGFIKTAMVAAMPQKVIEKMEATVPLQKLGEPEDIANAYAFLASDEAKYITGHVLHVDGAIMM